MRVTNQEQPFLPIYNYAVVTDRTEGLILVDINSMTDGEPRNNKLSRALTWNQDGVLDGANHITLGGYLAYITTRDKLVILSLEDPMAPKLLNTVPLNGGTASFLQFRYLFVTDADGLKVVDVTHPEQAFVTPNNTIALDDAKNVFLARTYAHVAAGDGLVIVDAERPTALKHYQTVKDGLVDVSDVIVATTNASLFAYVADGVGGLKAAADFTRFTT